MILNGQSQNVTIMIATEDLAVTAEFQRNDPFKHSHTKDRYEGQSLHHIHRFIAEVAYNLDRMILQGHRGLQVGCHGTVEAGRKPGIWVFYETQEQTSFPREWMLLTSYFQSYDSL